MSSSLIPKITAQLETLREPQLALVDHLVGLLQIPVQIFKGDGPNLISDEWASHFGDSLVAHHANSLDEFRKERFEHAYLRACRLCGIAASKPLSNTNPGYDLIIGGQRLALKTQADKKIKTSIVEISKFMELGSYDWQLEPLRAAFLKHLNHYDRVLILRALRPESHEKVYELLDIPKPLLLAAASGEVGWSARSKTERKTGWCYVPTESDADYRLTFDGGTECKLQLKQLKIEKCERIATWSFTLPQSQEVPAL